MRWSGKSWSIVAVVASLGAFSAANGQSALASGGSDKSKPDSLTRILNGRYLVLTHDCASCHGGRFSPATAGYLAGQQDTAVFFRVGGCFSPLKSPCYRTRARNLTPDNTTGLGRFSERQIFNALRYGLRPGETPDVTITSSTPGQGNFPAHPRYLAPPMPWPSWRHMRDQELWDIAAYLKYGVKPVHSKVLDSEGPADFWAMRYSVDSIGPYPSAQFPTANERAP
jgi:mono/diheme cytochrome c family protein